MTSKEFGKLLQDKLTSEYGVELSVASNQQIYRSLALICRQMMSENHKKFQSKAIGTGTKQVYYLCMEFLMGRSLKMSLFNLGLDEVAKKALADADITLDSIFEEEPDAGLGNGGFKFLRADLDGHRDSALFQLFNIFDSHDFFFLRLTSDNDAFAKWNYTIASSKFPPFFCIFQDLFISSGRSRAISSGSGAVTVRRRRVTGWVSSSRWECRAGRGIRVRSSVP